MSALTVSASFNCNGRYVYRRIHAIRRDPFGRIVKSIRHVPSLASVLLPAGLLLLGGVRSAEAADKERVRLTFNWGTGLVAAVHTRHTKSVSSQNRPLSDIVTERTFHAARQADGGYLVAADAYYYPEAPNITDQRALRSQAAVDGVFDPPFRVSRLGEFQGLENYEKTRRDLMESTWLALPHARSEIERTQIRERIDAMLTHNFLEFPVRELWQASVEQWMILDELELGRKYKEHGRISLPAADSVEIAATMNFIVPT